MIKLSARATPVDLPGRLERTVWRVCGASELPGEVPLACLVARGHEAVPGHRLYLTGSPDVAGPGPAVELPVDLGHLEPGDVIGITPDGRRITVLWKQSATHNSLLLTEQCDNYCLMCSQPPKDRDDAWLFHRAKETISLLPPSAHSLGLTGGELTVTEEGH